MHYNYRINLFIRLKQIQTDRNRDLIRRDLICRLSRPDWYKHRV